MRDAINTGLEQAIRGQDRRRTNMLRLISTTIRDRDVAARNAGGEALSDAEIHDLLCTMIKQRKASALEYEAAGRQDLADAECAEMDIIRGFMPRQLDAHEVAEVCSVAIAETGAHGLRDMGRCMASLKSRYAGQMDFGKASQIVRQKLG